MMETDSLQSDMIIPILPKTSESSYFSPPQTILLLFVVFPILMYILTNIHALSHYTYILNNTHKSQIPGGLSSPITITHFRIFLLYKYTPILVSNIYTCSLSFSLHFIQIMYLFYMVESATTTAKTLEIPSSTDALLWSHTQHIGSNNPSISCRTM